MAGEVSRPEAAKTPEAHLFNIGVMSDEQITVLNRGLWAAADYGPDQPEADNFDQMNVGDRLIGQLMAGVRELAARDPERVQQLVRQLTVSSLDVDQDMAAMVTPALLSYDYEFTRDTLISVYVGEANRHNEGGRGSASESALDEMRFLMRDHLSPEQTADFHAHAAMVDSSYAPYQLQPAGPDERRAYSY